MLGTGLIEANPKNYAGIILCLTFMPIPVLRPKVHTGIQPGAIIPIKHPCARCNVHKRDVDMIIQFPTQTDLTGHLRMLEEAHAHLAGCAARLSARRVLGGRVGEQR